MTWLAIALAFAAAVVINRLRTGWRPDLRRLFEPLWMAKELEPLDGTHLDNSTEASVQGEVAEQRPGAPG